MSYSIEIRDLRKSFRSKDKIIKAVDGISLSVKKGEIFGFLGPNGAGKSTTLRMLTTLLPIDEGQAIVCGYDMRTHQNQVRRHIGYVSQMGGADLPATGRENLMLAGRLYGMSKAQAEKRTDELVMLCDLKELENRPARTYSGGQKRRLEVALAMINKPEVLFLDEPTTGLDPQNRANMWEQIRKLRDLGTTVFLTTHYLEEADELCDRLCIMDYGKIVAEGTPSDLKHQISGDVVKLKLKAHSSISPDIFKALPYVNESRFDGDNVHLYTSNGAKLMQELFAVLEKHNLVMENISLSQASLDDVFLKKTGRLLRDTEKEEPNEAAY